MKNNPRVPALALVCLVCMAWLLASVAAPAAFASDASESGAQEGKPQLVIPLRGGAYVSIATETSPAASSDVAAQSFIEAEDRPNLVHRVFVDAKNELFFGYELLVEPVGAARRFRVSVRPLSAEYVQALRARPAFARRQLHPSYSAAAFPVVPQLVEDGDTIALDVLQNPRTGEKVVDLVTVSAEDPRRQAAAASREPARDLSLEDVYINVFDYKVNVNGRTVHRSSGGIGGPVFWFSVGGRGRFIVSLVERPGHPFEKVARVGRNRLAFEWGGESYEIVTGQPVIEIGGNWTAWVMHDPDYDFEMAEQERAPERARFEEHRRKAAALKLPGRAEHNTPPAVEVKRPPRNRTRVVMGGANNMELLFPKK